MIDTHAHLDQLEDIEDALAQAREAGLKGVIAVGMDLSSNRAVLDLARKHAGYVFASLGAHPWSMNEDDMDENLAFIEAHIDLCIAVGEIGLDYKLKVKKELQRAVFEKALEIAARNDKPVSIHARYSHDRAYRMVREAGVTRAVFHWYTGPTETLERILDQGYMISATPALSYSSAHREAMLRSPLERILVETDSPVLYQGKASKPSDIPRVIEELARIKKEEIGRVNRVTTDNAVRLFGIEPR